MTSRYGGKGVNQTTSDTEFKTLCEENPNCSLEESHFMNLCLLFSSCDKLITVMVVSQGHQVVSYAAMTTLLMGNVVRHVLMTHYQIITFRSM